MNFSNRYTRYAKAEELGAGNDSGLCFRENGSWPIANGYLRIENPEYFIMAILIVAA